MRLQLYCQYGNKYAETNEKYYFFQLTSYSAKISNHMGADPQKDTENSDWKTGTRFRIEIQNGYWNCSCKYWRNSTSPLNSHRKARQSQLRNQNLNCPGRFIKKVLNSFHDPTKDWNSPRSTPQKSQNSYTQASSFGENQTRRKILVEKIKLAKKILWRNTISYAQWQRFSRRSEEKPNSHWSSRAWMTSWTKLIWESLLFWYCSSDSADDNILQREKFPHYFSR